MTLRATNTGVANTTPAIPQNSPPNHNARKTRSGLISSRRPHQQGLHHLPFQSCDHDVSSPPTPSMCPRELKDTTATTVKVTSVAAEPA